MVRRPGVLIRPPREGDFSSNARHRLVTVKIGRWLGAAILLCFVTGLLSHLIQHPQPWFGWPSRPIWLYRVTQGIHVTAGIAAIPLLLAKLWSVYPKLFARPFVGSATRLLERASILVLTSSVFFELLTGLFNSRQNYPWAFFFPPVHYAVAWVAVGAVLVHLAVKLPVIVEAVRGKSLQRNDSSDAGIARRRFLRGTWLVTGLAVVATAGATIPWLRSVSVLAQRSDGRRLPVNRTADAAGVSEVDDSWRLTLTAHGRSRQFSLRQLAALPQHTAELPIACVEGWSQSASWTGVRVSELLSLAGIGIRPIRVISTERPGPYSSSVLPARHVADPLTLLALRLDGEPLSLDHGYPCRIMAPNRPGVLQTKWVRELVAL